MRRSINNSMNNGDERSSLIDADIIPEPIVLVFGTAFIMSEARAALGINEPRDSEVLELLQSEESSSNKDSCSLLSTTGRYLDSQVCSFKCYQ